MKIEELFSVRGKVALVTGGSRGIGEMIARAYVENGVKVYITARKAEACDALADELSKTGECISIPGDISRIDEIDRLGTEIERRERRLDILVNNAGASWGADFQSFPESGWDKVMDLNVKSAFFMTQRALQATGSSGLRRMTMPALSISDRSKACVPRIWRHIRTLHPRQRYPSDPHDGEIFSREAHRGQRHCSRLFSVQDDRRYSRGRQRGYRTKYPDATLGTSGRHGGRGACIWPRAQRLRLCGSTVVVDGGLATTG